MFNFDRENTSSIAKWWRNIDKAILFLFVFLFLLGLFFTFSSTSSMLAEKMNKQTYFFFTKHLIFVFIALFLLVIISIQDRNKLIKFLPYLFLISLLLLFLIPLFGAEVKGSKRWMDIPFLPRFQPIELIKPLFIIFIAKIIVGFYIIWIDLNCLLVTIDGFIQFSKLLKCNTEIIVGFCKIRFNLNCSLVTVD